MQHMQALCYRLLRSVRKTGRGVDNIMAVLESKRQNGNGDSK